MKDKINLKLYCHRLFFHLELLNNIIIICGLHLQWWALQISTSIFDNRRFSIVLQNFRFLQSIDLYQENQQKRMGTCARKIYYIDFKYLQSKYVKIYNKKIKILKIYKDVVMEQLPYGQQQL